MRAVPPLAVLVLGLAIPYAAIADDASQDGNERRKDAPAGNVVDQVLEGDYWTGYYRVPYELVRAPLDWNAAAWGKAALIGAALGAVVALDDPIQDVVQNVVRSDATDSIADFGNFFGTNVAGAALTGAGLLVGAATGDTRLSGTALVAIQSLAITAGLTEGIKRLAGRERPNHTDDSYDFKGPGARHDANSFVSGHVSGAFSVATVIATEYDDVVWVPPVTYGLAALVGFSRLNDNKHWTSDVVAGAALGFAVGKIAHRLSPFGDETNSVTMTPYTDGETTGIRFSAKF